MFYRISAFVDPIVTYAISCKTVYHYDMISTTLSFGILDNGLTSKSPNLQPFISPFYRMQLTLVALTLSKYREEFLRFLSCKKDQLSRTITYP